MSAAREVGFIFQCTLCGSYSIFAVDALDPVEIELHAETQKSSSKAPLQKDLRAMEQVFIERMQARFAPAAGEASPQQGFALLPCATCIEILTDVQYGAWLDAKENLSKPCHLCPQVAVTFEAEEACPAYVHKGGEWVLAQGVGPKDLEVKLPHRLPAGQFRTLLPPQAPVIRPPCWGTISSQRKGGGLDEEPPEKWDERRELIEAVAEMAGRGHEEASVDGAAKKTSIAKRNADRGPPQVGRHLPWLEELLEAAAESAAERRKKGASKVSVPEGVHFVAAPLLAESETILPLATAKLYEQ